MMGSVALACILSFPLVKKVAKGAQLAVPLLLSCRYALFVERCSFLVVLPNNVEITVLRIGVTFV